MPLLPVVLMLPRESRTEERKPSTTQQNEEHNRTSCPDGAGVPPMLLADQDRKPTRIEGTQQGKEGKGKGNERKAATSPQAHKKGVPPPIARSSKHSPSSQIRAKKSAKSRLGRFEKIFGKIFRGNVSGAKKNPSRFSTEGA